MCYKVQVVFGFLCIITSLGANNVSITIDPEAVPDSSCQEEIAENMILCKNLDSAIEYTVSLDLQNTTSAEADRNGSVTISLPNGVHYITTQTNFGDANVNFIGLDHSVTVECNYYTDNETLDAAQIHTWYFNKSESVRMENIHFKNCGFPFRFIFIQKVNIANCTYM